VSQNDIVKSGWVATGYGYTPDVGYWINWIDDWGNHVSEQVDKEQMQDFLKIRNNSSGEGIKGSDKHDDKPEVSEPEVGKPNPRWYEHTRQEDPAMSRWEESISNSKTLNGYQDWTNTTALFTPMIDKALGGDDSLLVALLLYLSNTINEEAGEIAGKTKRLIRDHGGEMNDDVAEDMALELGDLVYYIAQYAQAIGYDLQEVVDMNVAKLEDRKERGLIKGSGDKR
jgi:NTP pyrophosphatase (non-canonical NTP hydrolase)